MIGPEEIAQLAPAMSLTPDAVYPVMGALYHPPGGIIRHDAVVWGLASGGRRGGRGDPPVQRGHRDRAHERAGHRRGPRPTGADLAGTVVSATAGWSSTVAAMAGVELPITTHILQAFVTEPLKPLLDIVVVSSQMHVYISQTDRGEFLVGAEIEPWTTYRQQGTLTFLQECSRAHARAVPAARARADPAELGRPLRHHARLQPDPRPHRGRRVPAQRRLGDLRLQGGADRRQDAGRADRDGRGPGADRVVHARALLQGPARL